MADEIILHYYDASPFAQKTLRMLAIKGLAWQSVETPVIAPKPDLVVLTGGYRGTPVLQMGADVYIDSQRIAVELEDRFPVPTLFPNGNRGLPQGLAVWSDAFFQAGLFMAIALQSEHWPEDFKKDRMALYGDPDVAQLQRQLGYFRSQLRAHAGLINTQLDDGRPFLQGEQPSIADVHAFAVPWFTRVILPEVNDLLSDFTFLPAWEARVAALGEGTRTVTTAVEAHRIARASTSTTSIQVDTNDAQGLTPDQSVTVTPVDSRRGDVRGRLVTATANTVAVRHENDTVGEMVVHFPRIGYRVVAS